VGILKASGLRKITFFVSRIFWQININLLIICFRYKDDIPYPWLGGGGSSFILDPATVNQTIYSGAVLESDAGQYKCVVRNDTHSLSHTISLTVLGQ